MDNPLAQLDALPRAFGEVTATGQLRSVLADFQVSETLTFEPSGKGEHLFLYIEKQNLNTADVVRLLSQFSGVHPKNIGFAGLKDKRAITRQFFSVFTTGMKTVDWADFNSPQIHVLSTQPHLKKCRRGVVKHNQFNITVRHIKGEIDLIEKKLTQIQHNGFPNYFTAQRFGIEGKNLIRANQLFSSSAPRFNRSQKNFAYSAARAWLFNLVLSERIKDNSWNGFKTGDLMNLAGTNQLFASEKENTLLFQRLKRFDIHPTGVMAGKLIKGRTPTAETLILENQILDSFKHWQQGLIQHGLETQRRPLRAIAQNLTWQWHTNNLQLSFKLNKGSYATALLREVFDFNKT